MRGLNSWHQTYDTPKKSSQYAFSKLLSEAQEGELVTFNSLFNKKEEFWNFRTEHRKYVHILFRKWKTLKLQNISRVFYQRLIILKIKFFWNVTPYWLVSSYGLLAEAYCFHFQGLSRSRFALWLLDSEYGGTAIFRNVGNSLRVYMV